MKSVLLVGLLPLIQAVQYKVEIVHGADFPDEDMDINLLFTTIKRTNDPYIEIIAYGDCGDTCIKSYKTSIQESTETPEWDEGFVFDEETDNCGKYTKIMFKAWDDDSLYDGNDWVDADFLGETGFWELDTIEDCDKIYAKEMELNTSGYVFVEISKTCDSESSDDDKDESSEKDKDESSEKDKDEESSGEEDKDKDEGSSSEVSKEEIEEELKKLEEEEEKLEKEIAEEVKEENENKGGGGGKGRRLLERV